MKECLKVSIWLIIGCLLFAFPVACGKNKEGEFCNVKEDCEGELACLRNRCVVRKTYPTDDASVPEEPTASPDKTPDTNKPDASEPTIDKAPDKPVGPEPKPEPRPEPQPEPKPEPTPEPKAEPTPSNLTLYQMLTPGQSTTIQDGAQVKLNEVVVTTPIVRLSNTLNTFFVQEQQQNNGSYKYGGMMIIYNRQTYANVTLSLGSIIDLEGKFTIYKASGATIGMPQVELSAMPVNRGNTPPPQPEILTPAQLRADATGQPYLGVLVGVTNVEVSNANPDAPKDYSEFSIAAVGDTANDLRVDDLINTILYTGSKFCFGCGSSPKKPDDSYCLPGDTCQCSGKTGRCFTGQARDDMRKKGDKFTQVNGVLYYSFGQFKLLPRIPTDMQ